MGSNLHIPSQGPGILIALAFLRLRRMIPRVVVRQALPVFLIGIFSWGIASASRPEPIIPGYVHTAWTEKDGAPGGIQALAQTPDGFLWIGAGTLYRFDGTHFQQYEPPTGPALPSAVISTLLALPNGDLWIGFYNGEVSRLKRGRVVNYANPLQSSGAQVRCFARDNEGRILAAGTGGLARFEGDRWIKLGKHWNFTSHNVQSLFVDRKGTLWVVTNNATWSLPRGANKFQSIPIQVGQVGQVQEAPNGKLWMAETSRSVRPIPLNTNSLPSDETEVQVGSPAILFARDGSLWIATLGDGLRRVDDPEKLRGKTGRFSPSLERFTEKDGLTSDAILSILQDRQGNIWVGTLNGLDRFRRSIFTPLALPGEAYNDVLVPANDGNIWAIGDALDRVHGFKIKRVVLPPSMASYSGQWGILTTAYRDPTGAVWWVTTKELLRSRGDHFTRLQLPKGLVDPYSSRANPAAISMDPEGILWMDSGHKGLFYRKADTWHHFDTPPQITAMIPASAYTDDSGRVWFGYKGGAIIYLQSGKIHIVASGKDSPIGDIEAIRGDHRKIWIAGIGGLAFLDGKRLLPVRPFDSTTFIYVTGLEETADGSLWLRTPSGVVRITPSELRRFLASPAYRVHYQIFDSLDGLPGKFANLNNEREILDSKGRLWFAASDGVVSLNPANIPKSSQPPPTAITAVIADGRRFSWRNIPTLPPLPRRLEIDFSGLDLSIPERVRCRYELMGIDKGWQYAGTNGQALYTNLGPGKYLFRVDARNAGGRWNAQDTVMVFRIAPAWFQTLWLRTLVVLIALLILWMIYRIRLRQVSKAMTVRFDDRLTERTRIARELHDTLLQTIQGSKLVVDSALKQSQDTVRVHSAMEQLSVWLGQATEEGRAALNSLRTSVTQTNDLAEAFRRSIDECKIQSVMQASFSVAGEVSEMHPIVRDEVFRIGYEAIRNACAHSQASSLRIDLIYAEDLTLRVSDNGIGIDPNTATEGKKGHFGIQGMRERADRIMSKLTIDTSASSGTEIKLVVPGIIIYRKNRKRSLKSRTIRLLLKRAGLRADSFDS